jgi:ribose transport system ATP-binding protein
MSDLDPTRSIGTLSIAQRQWLEIARALVHPSRVLVLDEPTSSLARGDVTRLFGLVRAASQQGTAVLYVSHALEEVRELCTHWTVLRDGHSVASGEVSDTPISRLIAHMAGRELGELYPRQPHAPAEELLRVSLPSSAQPLIVRRGEVVGIYGLIGAGRSELLRGIFGLDPLTAGLEVLHARGARTPAERWATGVGMVVEDRAREGLFLERSLADNLSLPALAGLFSSPAARRAFSEPWRARLAIKSAGVDAPMRTLSGGNQQKVALARLLAAQSQLFLLDEPTRGVDVRAKSEIYRWIDTIASEQRGGVLLVSSYAPELLGVCDSIRVMQNGVLGAARPAEAWTQEMLVEAAFGAERAA